MEIHNSTARAHHTEPRRIRVHHPPFDDVRESVTTTLTRFLETEGDNLGAIAPEAADLAALLAGFLEGGKCLRPMFVHAGACAANPSLGAADANDVATLGAAVELVQAAALIHDDVLDHSPTRRGRPAIHAAATHAHEARNLAGSAEDFGIATAVILGDLALALAHQLASHAFAGADDRAHFHALCAEVMAGQYLDILNQSGAITSTKSATDSASLVTRWKTVSYTVHRPLMIGATRCGASPALLDSLGAYARPAGEAFQLRDDLDGVFGDEAALGKSTSSDIREGKRTILLALAQERAGETDRSVLAATVGNPDADTESIERVREIMTATGARESVENLIRQREDDAREVIANELSSLTSNESCELLDSLVQKLARTDR